MLKILLVFGTRPEAIKMAPLVHELRKRTNIDFRVCVTAQHREMLDSVLNLFNIQPDYDLNIMQAKQSLQDLVIKMLPKLSAVVQEYEPDYVLVHGDTATTFITSLAAFYEKTAVAHVEAGLRTYNLYSPWPEEANRRLTGVLSTLHFAPTEHARQNLLQEHVPTETICVTGNTIIDALLLAQKQLGQPCWQKHMAQHFPFLQDSHAMVLVTVHRRENHGTPLKHIAKAILTLAQQHPSLKFVLPLHPNPQVKEHLEKELARTPNIHLIPPQEYLAFVYLMHRALFILSDSGGIQEEAPALGKPVLVLRNTTERPEAIEAGTVKLVGADTHCIIDYSNRLLSDSDFYTQMAQAKNPYGDGHASKRIVDFLLEQKTNLHK